MAPLLREDLQNVADWIVVETKVVEPSTPIKRNSAHIDAHNHSPDWKSMTP
jgi:hypothetical protein